RPHIERWKIAGGERPAQHASEIRDAVGEALVDADMNRIGGDAFLDPLQILARDGAWPVEIALQEKVEHRVGMGAREKRLDAVHFQIREKTGIGVLHSPNERVL